MLVRSFTGMERFFAMFNKGTSLVELLRYAEAAVAFDTAFDVYFSTRPRGFGDPDDQGLSSDAPWPEGAEHPEQPPDLGAA